MLKEIRQKLSAAADDTIAETGKRFFKESVKLYGIKSQDVRKIAREYFSQIDDMKKSDVFGLCAELMKSDFLEEFSIACDFAYRKRNEFEKSDFEIFESWVKNYINNWAKCDTFCNHTLNALIEKFPEFISNLKKWAKSNNRWVRRASAVTFIISARRGRFIDDAFEIADILLTDADDMVQKGYGWALKASGEFAPKQVYDFVTARADRMPRTAYRYAIEKLPPDMRKSAMKI